MQKGKETRRLQDMYVHPVEVCNRDGSRDVRKEVENVVRIPREKMIGMDQRYKRR